MDTIAALKRISTRRKNCSNRSPRSCLKVSFVFLMAVQPRPTRLLMRPAPGGGASALGTVGFAQRRLGGGSVQASEAR